MQVLLLLLLLLQFVQSKMRNCAVQKHKVEDIILQLKHLSK